MLVAMASSSRCCILLLAPHVSAHIQQFYFSFFEISWGQYGHFASQRVSSLGTTFGSILES
ncbi:hypothetical protein SLEP1_g16820 [Rubroshorea leprosula]|uniref:Secreted protein n=1 Tax=Rubroshorea leprosula TaxID=152421 RepID=A0AAV5J3S3_9ROSI|nr:hypothetical protein SLEP1_g16820 [Rubroshorea leprosula]